MLSKIRRRASGVPRSSRELDRSLQALGELRGLGWHRSIRIGRPVDGLGAPLPWFAYPAIAWIEARLRGTEQVFEYGSGSSTLWFAQRVRAITTVEHDPSWARSIRQLLPAKGVLIERSVEEREEAGGDFNHPYVASILDSPDHYDIVIVDGMFRDACALIATTRLRDEGILVFDNSHRSLYRSTLGRLSREGFWRVDFEGFTPGAGVLGTTSILGRDLGHWLKGETEIRDTGW
jgi:hypothetical protein